MLISLFPLISKSVKLCNCSRYAGACCKLQLDRSSFSRFGKKHESSHFLSRQENWLSSNQHYWQVSKCGDCRGLYVTYSHSLYKVHYQYETFLHWSWNSVNCYWYRGVPEKWVAHLLHNIAAVCCEKDLIATSKFGKTSQEI